MTAVKSDRGQKVGRVTCTPSASATEKCSTPPEEAANDQTSTYAFEGHGLVGLGLLDAVAMVLVTLVVVGVVLGLGHDVTGNTARQDR